MEIAKNGPSGFKLKGKKAVVTIDSDKIVVGEFVINRPGEYEVAGVEVLGFKDNLYRLKIDNVSVGILNRKLTDEEKAAAGTINIAIVPTSADYDVDLEPAYVISRTPAQGTVTQPKLVTSADKLPETTTVIVLE